MPLKLIGKATEKSSIGVKWTFTKADGSDAIVTALTWTLTDIDGNVINSRQGVVVSTPQPSETVILSGNDLVLQDQSNDYELRVMTIEAMYDPENGDEDVPLKESAEFPVYNLRAIS